jgi:hypothetical protein
VTGSSCEQVDHASLAEALTAPSTPLGATRHYQHARGPSAAAPTTTTCKSLAVPLTSASSTMGLTSTKVSSLHLAYSAIPFLVRVIGRCATIYATQYVLYSYCYLQVPINNSVLLQCTQSVTHTLAPCFHTWGSLLIHSSLHHHKLLSYWQTLYMYAAHTLGFTHCTRLLHRVTSLLTCQLTWPTVTTAEPAV